jgi:serine/threonine protein phosphatase PrpC
MENKASNQNQEHDPQPSKLAQKMIEMKKAIGRPSFLHQKDKKVKNMTSDSFFSVSNTNITSRAIFAQQRNTSITHRLSEKENHDSNLLDTFKEETKCRSFRRNNIELKYEYPYGSLSRKMTANKTFNTSSFNPGQNKQFIMPRIEEVSPKISNSNHQHMNSQIGIESKSQITKNTSGKNHYSILPTSFQKQIIVKNPPVLKTMNEKCQRESFRDSKLLSKNPKSNFKFQNVQKIHKKEMDPEITEKQANRDKVWENKQMIPKVFENEFKYKLSRLFERNSDRNKQKVIKSSNKRGQENDLEPRLIPSSDHCTNEGVSIDNSFKLAPPSEVLIGCLQETPNCKILETLTDAGTSQIKENLILFVTAETNKGTTRETNEDRISIVLNISYHNDEKFNYFSVYDGHAGAACSEYLKENLHRLVSNDSSLFENFDFRMKHHFRDLDNVFLKQCDLTKETAGSCAISVLTYKNNIYVANTGDCRAFMSTNMGKYVVPLSIDHKPEFESEKERIFRNGGYLYCTSTQIFRENEQKVMNGPIRVFPGRLTTSRSFGDIEAKNEKYGGLSGVLIVEPETFCYNSDNTDFVVIGSDGLYEQLSNEEISKFVWEKLNSSKRNNQTFTQQLANQITEDLIYFSMESQSMDNISAVILFFRSCI